MDFSHRHFSGLWNTSKWPDDHGCNFDLDRLFSKPLAGTN